ncbi:hypothetical protein [Devosia sp.]|uniref:hypothetical protein n=1 Tax=Devosia sp. TaxID=1871048 RepID=UPI0035AF9B2D
MAIKSSAFGRVTLTEQDAKKFQAQATYGKPKAAAKEAAKRGIELSRALTSSGGRLRLTLEPAE